MTNIEIAKTIFNPPEYERWKKNYNRSRRSYKDIPYYFGSAFYVYSTPEGSNYWKGLLFKNAFNITKLKNGGEI